VTDEDKQEMHGEDCLFVLKSLLAAYQAFPDEELKKAKSPEDLKKEAEGRTPSCDDEITLANRIFDKFFTEEVALRALPAEAPDSGTHRTLALVLVAHPVPHYFRMVSLPSPAHFPGFCILSLPLFSVRARHRAFRGQGCYSHGGPGAGFSNARARARARISTLT
jgi:hypothetical protein